MKMFLHDLKTTKCPWAVSFIFFLPYLLYNVAWIDRGGVGYGATTPLLLIISIGTICSWNRVKSPFFTWKMHSTLHLFFSGRFTPVITWIFFFQFIGTNNLSVSKTLIHLNLYIFFSFMFYFMTIYGASATWGVKCMQLVTVLYLLIHPYLSVAGKKLYTRWNWLVNKMLDKNTFTLNMCYYRNKWTKQSYFSFKSALSGDTPQEISNITVAVFDIYQATPAPRCSIEIYVSWLNINCIFNTAFIML